MRSKIANHPAVSVVDGGASPRRDAVQRQSVNNVGFAGFGDYLNAFACVEDPVTQIVIHLGDVHIAPMGGGQVAITLAQSLANNFVRTLPDDQWGGTLVVVRQRNPENKAMVLPEMAAPFLTLRQNAINVRGAFVATITKSCCGFRQSSAAGIPDNK